MPPNEVLCVPPLYGAENADTTVSPSFKCYYSDSRYWIMPAFYTSVAAVKLVIICGTNFGGGGGG